MIKKKKRLIILSCLVATLIVIVVFCSTIFSVKSVTVEYKSRLSFLTVESISDSIENAGIKCGSNILFKNYDDNIHTLEKDCPYLRVDGIERKFPSDLVLHLSERTPVVRVLFRGKYYVLDNDLKILNIVASNSDYNSITNEKNVPLLSLGNFEEFIIDCLNLEKGEKLDNERLRLWVDAFYRGAVCCSNEDSQIAISKICVIKSIVVNYIKETNKVAFDVNYNNTSIVSTIYGETKLVDSVYKVLTAVTTAVENLQTFEYINCIDGETVYGKLI